MRKMTIGALVLCLAFSTASKAIEPVTISALATTIALPLAKAAYASLASSEPAGCKAECYEGGKFCTSKIKRSQCKSKCTRFSPVGDYELRVRFTVDAQKKENSLYNCVMKGVKSGTPITGENKKSRNVDITKSIAVYTTDQLEEALKLLYQYKSAKMIAESNPQYLLSQYPKEIKAVQAAEKVAQPEPSEPSAQGSSDGKGAQDENAQKTLTVFAEKSKSKEMMGWIAAQIEKMRVTNAFGPQ